MKMWLRFGPVVAGLWVLPLLVACGSKATTTAEPETAKDVKAERQLPPAPAEPKDMSLPPVRSTNLDNLKSLGNECSRAAQNLRMPQNNRMAAIVKGWLGPGTSDRLRPNTGWIAHGNGD